MMKIVLIMKSMGERLKKLTFKQINYYSKKINLLKVLKHYNIKYERQSGTNRYVSLCPFHGDENPSLVTYENDDKTYSYCCYACGEAGDVFQFIRKKEDDDFKKAVEKLLQFIDEKDIDTSLVGYYNQLKEEGEEQESKSSVIFTYRHYLGVCCRNWLQAKKESVSVFEYEKKCQFIDKIFEEMDDFFDNCSSVEKAEQYYNNKVQLLNQ